MSDWKDEYRDRKEASGLTWDQFVDRQLVHVDDLDSGTQAIEALTEHVEALTAEYQELRRELQEVRMLYESDEFEA